MTALRRVFAAAAAALAAAAVHAAPYTSQGSCAGWPRVQLTTPAGSCVALVADAAQGLVFPRRILEVAPGRFFITDMGGWDPHRGRLLSLQLDEQATPPRASVQVLAQGLDRPHGLALGPDGRVYVGEAGRIWRTPASGPVVPEVIVDGLPADGAHPLKELVFGERGALFINVGSFSDGCRADDGQRPLPCPETQGERPRAAVWVAQLGGPQFTLQSLRPYATGLRNSLALAWLSGPGVLLQGENSIDYPDANQPPEELNLLRDGAHYGWPTCVGARQTARGYEGRADCTTTTAPLALWPAHAAPLQMLAVPPQVGHAFAGQLLVAWHGYKPAGHRVMGFALDARGRPTKAKPQEWIGGWTAEPGVRPQGAPTGIALDHRGRLWVVEDRHRTVLMLVPGAAPQGR